MQLKSLRLFVAVAETGSFAKAAARCHTVQSNVTAHIKKLEQELDRDLFVRSRGIRLTSAGQTLLRHARRLLGGHDDALAALSDAAAPAGTLAIGAMETTAAIRLPAVLNAYHRQYPHVDLELSTGGTADLVDRLLEGALDCAFVAGPVSHPRLHSLFAFQETLVLVSGRPIDALPTPQQFMETPFLAFRQGCHYRQRIELLLASRGVTHGRIFDFGTVDGILGCVAAGMGFALLPRAAVIQHQHRLALHYCAIPRRIGDVTTHLALAHPSGWSPALEAFADTVTRCCESPAQDPTAAAATA